MRRLEAMTLTCYSCENLRRTRRHGCRVAQSFYCYRTGRMIEPITGRCSEYQSVARWHRPVKSRQPKLGDELL